MDLFSRREVLGVAELLGQVKRALEERWDFVWVQGEVSGLRRPGSGHLYFSLTDGDAALRAVMFRHQAKLMRVGLEDGAQVRCQGRLTVYSPRGDLQLVVDAVEPLGAGALALAFEELKRRLAAQGFFDPERKRPLPEVPRRVAVITSPTGAAIRDFLNVLHRRFAGVEVAVYPVRVQGDQAAGQMITALDDLAAWGWPEVIVLTRGGGSPEDLWAFNDEALAKAIAISPIPTVSAVGHEVDFTICDLVADLRAPTPSAAAELLVASRAQLTRRLAGATRRLVRLGPRLVGDRREDLRRLVRDLGDPRRELAERWQRVDELASRAGRAMESGLHGRQRDLWALRRRLEQARPDRALAGLEQRRRELAARMAVAQERALAVHRRELAGLAGRLSALSPLGVLQRGYALVTDQEGRVVRRAEQTQAGDELNLKLAQGGLGVKVTEVRG